MIKNTRKFFAVTLVLTMLFTCFTFTAGAAENQRYIITSQKGRPGDTISVRVSLSDVKNLQYIDGIIKFNNNAFEVPDPDGITVPLENSFGEVNYTISNETGQIQFSGAAVIPYSATETAQPTVMIIDFIIKPDAAYGTYYATMKNCQAMTADNTVEPLGEPGPMEGVLTVTDHIPETPSPSPSESPSPSPSESASPSPTPTDTPDDNDGTGTTYAPGEIPTAEPTSTPTVTPTPTPTATVVPTLTPIATPTVAPTDTPAPVALPTDINEISWASDYIADVISRGIMKGYTEEDGSITFKPSGTATRAEFATALFNYMGFEKDGTAVFDDTKDHWAKDYIAKMVKQGIMAGYSDTQFGPDDPITREQMATILNRAFKPQAIFDNFQYADNSEISSWAAESVYAVQGAGWMSGDAGGTFRPADTATRAEIATIFSRLAKDNVK